MGNAVLNPSQSFLARKKVNPRILSTFKRIVRDSEQIRLLKSPGSLSVYILTLFYKQDKHYTLRSDFSITRYGTVKYGKHRRWWIANEARSAELAITNISYPTSANGIIVLLIFLKLRRSQYYSWILVNFILRLQNDRMLILPPVTEIEWTRESECKKCIIRGWKFNKYIYTYDNYTYSSCTHHDDCVQFPQTLLG